MSRGPYKRYEYDPTISIPKTTSFNRRKRNHEEIEAQNVGVSSDASFEEQDLCNEVIHENEDSGLVTENHNEELHDEVESEDEDIVANANKIQCDNYTQNEENSNETIYPGSNVTKAQGLLLVLCFILRHKLTDVALGDLLLLFNSFIPNMVPATKHLFFRAIELEHSQKHFYCSSCSAYIGNNTAITTCKSCDSPFNDGENIKNGHYFIYIPLRKQIETLLSNAKLYTYLTNRNLDASLNSLAVTDVTTAALYKELITIHGLSSNDLSLTWNTDGVPVFNSSNYSIWPLQATVNELPPHLRAKNILLLGLWFGDKPNMNVFLVPFVEECSKLETEGFVFGNEIKPRKVFALLLSADSPARAIVRNAKQFNGEYGCDWCEFQGVKVATNNNGPPVRYYPHRLPVVMRSAKNQATYALQATTSNPVKGVKGMTVIDLLPSFDTVRGTVVDYMHSVCQGVMRLMVDLWFDTKHHGEMYYIGQQIKLVDKRLQEISPPSEIHRSPRSISQRHYWKASEWRAFIFYSLVVLHGVLPRCYLNHFFLFVYGVYTLLGDSISSTSICLSELCLTKFVINLEELYGLTNCKFNAHCLTHLAHCLKDCGPLWATSAFTFESHNHVLINMFNGTQCVPQQVADTFLLKMKAASLARQFVGDDSSSCVKDLLAKLTDNSRFMHYDSSSHITPLGCGKLVSLDVHMIVALEALLNLIIVNHSGKVYDRFLLNHKLYSSVSYTRSKRHTNHHISIQHSDYKYGKISSILCFKPLCRCSLELSQYCNCILYSALLVKPMDASNRVLCRDNDFKVNSNFIIEVEETDDVIAILPSQIVRKCICMSSGERTYLCQLPYRIYDD